MILSEIYDEILIIMVYIYGIFITMIRERKFLNMVIILIILLFLLIETG
jgi:hypothetical protein